jgi:sigma-B regulation protein RsbU (phosphoserine phosphatase)
MSAGSDNSRQTAQLRFLGAIVDRLTGAGDPLAALRTALPEIADLLNLPERALQLDQSQAEGPALVAVARAGISDNDDAYLAAISKFARQAVATHSLQGKIVNQEMITRELNEAVKLQQSLQPDSAPEHLPIWGMNLPARILSGDFFDFYRLDNDRIAFALGDVSGKGIDASLLMAKTVTLFRCLGKMFYQPSELLSKINSELCETASRGMFVTMVVGVYFPRSGKVIFANAGHQPPLFRKIDRSYDTYVAEAPPLGILPEITCKDEDIDLDGGEFYVFSDGLTEYRYGDGEMLGVDGLIQLFEVFGEGSPAERLGSLLDMLNNEEGWESSDDLTVLTINDSWVRHIGISESGI